MAFEDPVTDPLLSGVPVVNGSKVLEPVVLYRRIGSGAMGSVYHGKHSTLHVDVAVKVLKHTLDDPGVVTRFRREAHYAASVKHPNIVQVHDFREAFGLHYIVMEYILGESVGERIEREGPLGIREAIEITVGAASGLAAAHSRGVVHRDIKPANILLDLSAGSYTTVKIADLGLAKAADTDEQLSSTGVPMGTPTYMPPEQWDDAASVGPQGDIWALGATCYFMLAGEHAIEGSSIQGVLRQICLEPFPDIRSVRPDVPERLGKIIERCTRHDPRDRWSTAGKLVRALRQPMPIDLIKVGSARHPTRDGNERDGAEYRPAGPQAQRTPLVVIAWLVWALAALLAFLIAYRLA